MADQNNANEFEELRALQAEAVTEYEALSEDYWRTRKLTTILKSIGWVALAVVVIAEIAYIFIGGTTLAAVELVCGACWIVFTMIANAIELSALQPWRLAMIKYVGWNRIDDD